MKLKNNYFIGVFVFLVILPLVNCYGTIKETTTQEKYSTIIEKPFSDAQICLAPANLYFKHNFGKGVGHKGYSSAELFLIQTSYEHFSPFLDLRLNVMNEGKVGFNGGVGFRALTNSQVSIGGNFFYDYRASSKLHTHQIAGGIEFLSQYVDLRLNGYLPVGGTKHSNPLVFAGFFQNNINVKRITYYAFPCLNAEVGVPLPFTYNADLYLGIGPYYLFGETVSGNRYSSTWGLKLRLSAEVFRFVEIGFELNHDHIFKTTYQGIIGIRIPLYKNTACRHTTGSKKGKAYNKRTLQPTIRNVIIPVQKKSTIYPLKNQFGELVNVIFVNNQALAPGLGTFFSPYSSLALAEVAAPSDSLIYVFQGDGTSDNYNTGFVMKPQQILLGSGTSISLYKVTIPALTSGNPKLTNPGGNGVTLASDTIVKGMTIQSAGGVGIVGNQISNVNVNNNQVIGSTNQGIQITDSQGIALILNNQITNSGGTGIVFNSTNTGGQVYIGENTISDSTGSGDGIIIRVNHPNKTSVVRLNNITQTGPGIGLTDISSRNLQGKTIIDSNTMNSTSSRGILAFDGIQVISNNEINNFTTAAGQGIFYSTNSTNSGPRNVTISNNQVSINSTNNFGIDVSNDNVAGDVSANITGNHVTAFSSSGIRSRTSNPGTNCSSITSNTAPTFSLNGAGGGNVKISESNTDYLSSNIGDNFTTAGSVTFNTDCYSAP